MTRAARYDRRKTAALIIFVLRCVAAVTAAYFLAGAVGFPHPLWVCIFALVGSQDSATAIFMTIGGRVAGTIIGVLVAVAVGAAMSRFGFDTAWKIALSVAICAIFAWDRPAIQLCMWTPPIIFMTASPAESLIGVGFYRGCEVILGVLIGGLFLIAADKSLASARKIQHRGQGKS